MPSMNDQPLRPDATGSDRTSDRLPTYSIAEMAAMLGVSTDAVRARVNRGTLEGEKIAGVWRVRPPEGLSLQEIHEASRPDATGYQPLATVARPDALFEQMRDERNYLRAKLDQALEEASELRQIAAAERERADVLQREALGRIEALTATIGDQPGPTVRQPDATGTRSEAVESTESNETIVTGIVAWLRRLWGE
jgi:transposase